MVSLLQYVVHIAFVWQQESNFKSLPPLLSPRPMELTFAIDLKGTLMFAFVYSSIQINTASQENLKVPLSKDWVAFRGFTILERILVITLKL